MSEIASPAEPSRPDGNTDWATVPDHLVPARVVLSERTGQRLASRERSRFVKGPLPMGWIGAAARCGDARALPVLLALKTTKYCKHLDDSIG
jgi:hypothetical protein